MGGTFLATARFQDSEFFSESYENERERSAGVCTYANTLNAYKTHTTTHKQTYIKKQNKNVNTD